ncbi:MAG: efflux transporter outer membrane subunit [Novosphingobium sp.]|nr:efflux transporter outer membrane subunit [Novosphingobium sp.]
MAKLHILLAPVSALALAACAVGPDHVAPSTPTTSSGPFLSTTPAVTTETVQADWWRLYQDPVLDQLIDDALAHNTDIRVAVANIAKARALLRESKSDRLPQVGASAGTNYGRLPASQRAPGAKREDWYTDIGLDVSYEVDLFGRVSRGVEASQADLGAAQADADAVRVIVVAETARAYADAASAAERIDVAKRIVDLLGQSQGLTEKRENAGLATKLDVARIAALRSQRLADIPAIEAQRDAALFRLATLTGRAPRDLPVSASARTTMLTIEHPIPVGDGAALLARRPDVRAAERRLAGSTARIGVATADLYPRVTLGGSVGSTGTGFDNIFGANPLTWLLGPLINWTVNQDAARARIAAAKADSQAALATFDGTVLNALEETETALSAYGHALEQRQALQQARDEAERAAKITRAQQREGAIDALASLDAERTLADAEAQLALANAAIADRQIDLFRALGGKW